MAKKIQVLNDVQNVSKIVVHRVAFHCQSELPEAGRGWTLHQSQLENRNYVKLIFFKNNVFSPPCVIIQWKMSPQYVKIIFDVFTTTFFAIVLIASTRDSKTTACQRILYVNICLSQEKITGRCKKNNAQEYKIMMASTETMVQIVVTFPWGHGRVMSGIYCQQVKENRGDPLWIILFNNSRLV